MATVIPRVRISENSPAGSELSRWWRIFEKWLNDWRASVDAARPKAWAIITTDGAGRAVANPQYGVASLAVSGTDLLVELSNPMDGEWGAIATSADAANPLIYSLATVDDYRGTLSAINDAGASVSFATTATSLCLTVMGYERAT